MDCRCITKITDIPAHKWNALVPDNAPFALHEFLAALELSGCVKAENGWLPHHIVCWNGDELIAAMPFYIKGHSYGEYIFDWAWADAYQRHGYEYYPKGLCAIPFTPASTTKILIRQGYDTDVLSSEMINYALELAQILELSSIHSLFLNEQELAAWLKQDFIYRTSYQFHWKNNNYADFDNYLASFTSVKRKKIRQQRKSISRTDIEFRILHGQDISEQHWHDFYRFYKNTVRLHGAMAYLNLEFFLLIHQTMKKNTMMISVYENEKNIASALFFTGKGILYGRYWGCDVEINNLHFETCYYQAIDYCIRNKVQYFEAGAQGEHKLSRGLVPVKTVSAHWLRQNEFYKAVKQHIEYEANHVQNYIDVLRQHSPFKGN